MSTPSAYSLRRRDDAVSFRAAWEAALDYAIYRLEEKAIARAMNGVSQPIFHKGEQVGERREFDERLTMFLLRYRRPHRFGGYLDQLPPPIDPDPDEPAGRLLWYLGELEDRPVYDNPIADDPDTGDPDLDDDASREGA